MIQFFQSSSKTVMAVETAQELCPGDTDKLVWLFSGAKPVKTKTLKGWFVGPRREMITPWSTNAVEITQNMAVTGISRIEEYFPVSSEDAKRDPMLQRIYDGLDQDIFTVGREPDPIIYIDDIDLYNREEGLALNDDEVKYLNDVSKKLKRKLTDSEIFGFSQVNSEHCRHKIFNGIFVIDGKEMESSLFAMIKKTSVINPNKLVSAYKDNVAFNDGPQVEQFAPQSGDKPDFYVARKIRTVLSIKAETHNFPTTIEPFNGAATGTGGEIRDRLGGGKASLPIAGTAVYMTSYPRTEEGRSWENMLIPRKWLYRTPEQILIKASNGASDFGNKFGQPLICGSLLTFEHAENNKMFAFDKVIMLAGGVGYANKRDALKGVPKAHEKIVILGGDNYRIGMGGGAVSSVNTGQYSSGIELNAVQRANPEMQKRAANVIRSIAESDDNPIISIHDHGAGGHLNCLSELVETTGGHIDMSELPIGDPTLSAKEIIGNESQERMGLLIKEKDVEHIRRIAERERSPIYIVGETTGDMKFVFEQKDGEKPIDIKLEYMFGKPPRTVMKDNTVKEKYSPVKYKMPELHAYLEKVLQLESVACKDWLTNKVDRSVTGKVARQQCQGELQLPLSDLGAVALDYRGKAGIATSVGHAPQVALIDPATGSVMSIAEALTNIVFAPLSERLKSVSLSANWMWPCRNEGEDARLYKAVKAASDFACKLGINIPTGKDSLSMTQKYGKDKVLSPGTVIISAAGEVSDIRKIVSPILVNDVRAYIYYIDFSCDTFKLGGSAFAQVLGKISNEAPTVKDADYFLNAFNAIQDAIDKELILAGHDISAGGMITALLEMCFANIKGGMDVNLDSTAEKDIIKILFAENPGIIVQVKEKKIFEKLMQSAGVGFVCIARPVDERHILITKDGAQYHFGIDYLRDVWYKSSYLLDMRQSGNKCAGNRFGNYKIQPLEYKFHKNFEGTLKSYGLTASRRRKSSINAAVLRDKGSQCERETAYALHLAGFDVKDVHMTDLSTGRETLDDVNLIVFCGGFSNSDVLGSAKGWAAGILYNEKAKCAIECFYKRKDTLSIGICNGCQLMAELELLYPEHEKKHKMVHNDSHKFESNFISLEIPKNNSVMFGSLSGLKLGVWVAHGEGKFDFPYDEERYHIVAKYNYEGYPANPNGSPWAAAGICSTDGRHIAMMPHPERAIFPWQCGYYPPNRKNDEVTPWIEAFVNARKWIEKYRQKMY
ncbi:MAG: phosphoribosylformylglycinamidine synthase [Tannerella sp.]|jgi:phosphoribosylformylglycinamidine synthase|nr:phosphoribosylformylglycinamidine synthase [Tannerella sp.]